MESSSFCIGTADDGKTHVTTRHDDIKHKALEKLGEVHTRRGAHVEPSTVHPGRWTVDFTPMGGGIVRRPAIDAPEFPSHGSAIQFEMDLLDQGIEESSPLENEEWVTRWYATEGKYLAN